MKIGFICSAFDLLHAGHILALKEAKEHCDYLIVGLHVDPSKERKGKNHLSARRRKSGSKTDKASG